MHGLDNIHFHRLSSWQTQWLSRSYPESSRLSNHPQSLGFSRFCLKIPNPDQYAIGIGKILILTSVWCFQMNSYDKYTRTRNRVYLKLIPRKLKYTAWNYKIKLSTCMSKPAKKGIKNNRFSECFKKKSPSPNTRIAFESIKNFKFSWGDMPPDPPWGSHPQCSRDLSVVKKYPDFMH